MYRHGDCEIALFVFWLPFEPCVNKSLCILCGKWWTVYLLQFDKKKWMLKIKIKKLEALHQCLSAKSHNRVVPEDDYTVKILLHACTGSLLEALGGLLQTAHLSVIHLLRVPVDTRSLRTTALSLVIDLVGGVRSQSLNPTQFRSGIPPSLNSVCTLKDLFAKHFSAFDIFPQRINAGVTYCFRSELIVFVLCMKINRREQPLKASQCSAWLLTFCVSWYAVAAARKSYLHFPEDRNKKVYFYIIFYWGLLWQTSSTFISLNKIQHKQVITLVKVDLCAL